MTFLFLTYLRKTGLKILVLYKLKINLSIKLKNEYSINICFYRIGKKSTRLVNAAAVKLSEELFNMIDRPDHALVTRVREGTEPQVRLS